MGAIAQALGQGATLDYAGRKWQVCPWTYEVQGQYEQYLEDQALSRFKRQARLLEPHEADLFREKHLEMLGSRAWSFGTPLVYRSMASEANLAHLLLLCLRPAHPEADLTLTLEMVREGRRGVDEALEAANPTILRKPEPATTPPTSAPTT